MAGLEFCLNEHGGEGFFPYKKDLISSHPDRTPEDMARLAVKTKKLGYRLEQVQDFTPTPMTAATEIYYSGYHLYTLKEISPKNFFLLVQT